MHRPLTVLFGIAAIASAGAVSACKPKKVPRANPSDPFENTVVCTLKDLGEGQVIIAQKDISNECDMISAAKLIADYHRSHGTETVIMTTEYGSYNGIYWVSVRPKQPTK